MLIFLVFKCTKKINIYAKKLQEIPCKFLYLSYNYNTTTEELNMNEIELELDLLLIEEFLKVVAEMERVAACETLEETAEMFRLARELFDAGIW